MQWTSRIPDQIFEIGFWRGFGKVWSITLVQTLSKTYLGYPRDRFDIGFDQVFLSKFPQTLSKTLSRKIRSNILPVQYSDILSLSWAHLEGPEIYHLYFYIFAVGPKNTKCPRMGLIIGLRG